MDSIFVNTSVIANEAGVIGMTTAHGVLLLITTINMAFNIIIITTLFQNNSELVRSIRVILINILVACVIGGLVSATYHISSPILEFGGLSSDSVNWPPLCRSLVFLDHTDSCSRVLFAAYYSVTVFIVVHFWNKPVLAPRNTKYFIIASAVVWLLAVLVGLTSFFDETVQGFCNSRRSRIARDTLNASSQFTLPVTAPYFVVSSIPIIVTPVILIKTACYIKCKTIGDLRDAKKALVKFGLFLMIIQFVNVFAQVVVPLVLGVGRLYESSLVIIIGVALSDLSLIPTNVLIIIFFKPVQLQLKRWIKCCYHGCKNTPLNTAATM